ncbi:IF factor, partial [Campylorhamphus procurvoides]|nr:IF factor [Campylorhamphus procurvoides]
KGNGMIGNIYSMGLAMQALGATTKFYSPRDWDCAQAMDVVTKHDYELAMAIAQVLPALVDRSYLDAASLDCDATTDECPSLGPDPELPESTTNITVHYSITNELQGEHFHYSTWVTVPLGSRLLKVLEKAEEQDPEIFSFETKQTSWGPMVVSIHGLGANDNDRTYWQFLSSGKPLDEGVGSYKPKDGEHIKAIFSTW